MRRCSTCAVGLILLGPGCGRLGFDADSSGVLDAALSDAALSDATPDAVPLGPFNPPTLIAPLAFAGAFDDDPTVTADLLEMYFNSNRPGGPGGTDIWISKRSNVSAAWGAPTLVTQLNSGGNEETPEVTADGLVIRFGSDRSGTSGSLDIMEATRATRADAWSPPVFLPALSTTGFDACPVSSGADRVLVLCAGATGQNLRIYVATRPTAADPWGVPAPISELNTDVYQSDPQLDASGLIIVFSAGVTYNDTALYEASRPDSISPFGPRVSISELDMANRDDGPWVSNDRRYIVFASRRSGDMDIYEAVR